MVDHVEELAQTMHNAYWAETLPNYHEGDLPWASLPADSSAKRGYLASARAALAHLDYERVKARAELCEEMAKVVRETKRFCDTQTEGSRSSMIRPAWCSPMTKYGKTLGRLADSVLAKYDALEKGGS